jgi:ABC-type xylose transport system permease subunit
MRLTSGNSFGWQPMTERSLDVADPAWSADTSSDRHLTSRLAGVALRDSMLLIVLAAVWLFFYFATNGTFLTQRNLVLLALQTSIVSLAAISAVMLIVTRNFDLSVGSAVALVGVILALLTVKHDIGAPLAVIAALCGGLLMGAWQGLWVTRVGVSSFIVTLAGMLYFRGISMIATNGATVAPLPKTLTGLATGFLPSTLSIGTVVAAFLGYSALRLFELRRARALGVSGKVDAEVVRTLLPPLLATGIAIWIVSWQGIPYLVLLVAICTVTAEFVMRRTRYGAQLYAIGGNPEAARLSGIDVKRAIFWNFVIAGLAYGITGIALTARVSGAVGGSAGLFLELDAIAAAIIGGTSLAGGRGRVLGALVGALLMGSLNNGMSLMNVPTFYQDTARGAILLVAVAIDQFSRKRLGTI